jgi:uncharacterized membrane-anchored protein
MNRKWLLSLFILVAFIQLTVPLFMAWRWEDVLRTGRRFYWQTAPVDPYDAFKGRYVALEFKENTISGAQIDKMTAGQMVYAIIDENAEGKAYISGLSMVRPDSGYYIKAKAYAVGKDKIHIDLPFNRYYLPEELAAQAEGVYRESAGKQHGVAVVRIKDGYGVVEQLYVGDRTLQEVLQQTPRKEEGR